ncbi:hypothetical protein [Arachnia propionica]|uniref:Uncharacterized protein n=1 Tax=Arachnia propionica TaxID=1750 RepID=A0A3P1X0U2_9ACTN|nr:hypothetical protein [Arachnia propionica]RRD51310.1 hypothetical protein EII35_00015 [Arachnia propionica]
MIDIGKILENAEQGRDGWGSSVGLPVLERVARENELVLEWDEGAGEDWVLMRKAGELQVVAGVELPLAFLLDSNGINLPPPVVLVRVSSMTRPILCCTRSVLEVAFRRQFKAIDFYPAGFSVLDLAMATI